VSRAERVAAAAKRAVGCPFRLHGRDPADGLDCVGLAAFAFAQAGVSAAIPTGYALRGGSADRITALIDATGLMRAPGDAPGDLLLCQPGPAQFHLAIRVIDGIVHADAMLRRVVERPGPVAWPILARWRIGD